MDRAFLVLLLLPVFAVVAVLSDGASTNLYWPSDYGIFLIDMHSAAHFTQSLGISSRFGWSHPGPMNYYTLLPIYLATGEGVQSLNLGTFLINASSLGGSAFVVGRFAGWHLASLFVVTIAGFMLLVLPAWSLWDVLLPLSTFCPWILCLFLGCGVALGGSKWLPPFVAALCFVTQAHVAFWVPSAVLAIIATVFGLWFYGISLKYVAASILIAIVLWLPPLIEWNNLVRIVSFFKGSIASHSLVEAGLSMLAMLGYSVHANPQTFSLDLVRPFDYALGAALILIGVLVLVRGNRFCRVLSVLILCTSAVITTSLMSYAGPILPHSIIFAIAAVPLLLFCAASVLLANKPNMVRLLAVSMAVALTIGNYTSLSQHLMRSKYPNAEVVAMTAALLDGLSKNPNPSIGIETPEWPIPVGAIAQLYRQDIPFRIDPRWSIIFGHRINQSTETPRLIFRSGRPDGITYDSP